MSQATYPETSTTQPALSFGQVCITDQLPARESRMPEHANEVRAMQQLAGLLYSETSILLNELLALALRLCHAHSAGISLREGENCRWLATAGEVAGMAGYTVPLNETACGHTLATQQAELFCRPDQHYPQAYPKGTPPIDELLLVPWSTAGDQAGTLWIAVHDPSRHFDNEDVRILTGLSRFAAAATDASNLNAALRLKESESASLAMARELAHHLNNPLQSAILALDLISMPEQDEATRSQMLPIAREQVGRVAHIVQEILKLKKLPGAQA